MKQNEIATLSAEIIVKYYDNDYMAFLERFDDEGLWYGPRKGQFLKGREAMISAWRTEKNNLTFTMGNMRTRTISSHPSFCDVMLFFSVVTHFPNGADISVDQQVLLTWGERTEKDARGNRQKVPRILLCHISNPDENDEQDVIYPLHYGQVYAGPNVMPQKGERLHFTGTDRSEYFILSDSVLYIEATNDKHSVLHLADEVIEVVPTISSLASRHSRLFLRCHQSYLVNPNYIKRIRRFKVTLTNDIELPVPEKKYTEFKKRVMALFA